MRFTEQHIDDLLDAWPLLQRRPSSSSKMCSVSGPLSFTMSARCSPSISDMFWLRIDIPLQVDDELPRVYETRGRIPLHEDWHVNPSGDLCLGSPLGLRAAMRGEASLVAFVERCVVPFLYAISWRQQGRENFPFDELAHGVPGLVDDYESILQVRGMEAVAVALALLGLRPRVANKRKCPCGCAKRLGSCQYRWKLYAVRSLATRTYYRKVAMDFAVACPADPKPAGQARKRNLSLRKAISVGMGRFF